MKYSTDFEKDLSGLGYTDDEAVQVLGLLRATAVVNENSNEYNSDELDYE